MTAADGLAGIGGMADSMPHATRTAGLIRTATGRNELKPMSALNVHLASRESSSGYFWLTMVAQFALRDHHGRDGSGPRIHRRTV